MVSNIRKIQVTLLTNIIKHPFNTHAYVLDQVTDLIVITEQYTSSITVLSLLVQLYISNSYKSEAVLPLSTRILSLYGIQRNYFIV